MDILGGSQGCLPEGGGIAGEGGMSGLGGYAVGPGLCDKNPGWPGRGLGGRGAGSCSVKAEPELGLGLK